MRNTLIFGLACLLSGGLLAQTKMTITSGTLLYIADSTCLFMEDVDLINNGSISSDAGSVLMLKGSSNSLLGGIGTTALGSLKLSKTAMAELMLNGDCSISDSLSLMGGNLDLNGYTISLAETATIEGETAAKRIYGSSGRIEITQTLNAPGTVEPGKLGLQISSSDLLGSTHIVRSHTEQTMDDLPDNRSVLRYYDITPSLNTGLDVDLVFNYFDSELNSIPESELSLWRSDNSGTSWFELGVTDKSSATNFIEIENQSSLSRITAASASIPLPVELISFNGRCIENGIQLNWQTAYESQNDYFGVEYSADGRVWSELDRVEARGSNPEGASYVWQTERVYNGFFRLRQTDLDGESYLISDVIFLDCTRSANWQIFPNPMQQQGYIRLQLQESTAVSLHLINSLGQYVQQIQNTQLAAGEHLLEWYHTLPSGMYYLSAKLGARQFTIPIIIR